MFRALFNRHAKAALLIFMRHANLIESAPHLAEYRKREIAKDCLGYFSLGNVDLLTPDTDEAVLNASRAINTAAFTTYLPIFETVKTLYEGREWLPDRTITKIEDEFLRLMQSVKGNSARESAAAKMMLAIYNNEAAGLDQLGAPDFVFWRSIGLISEEYIGTDKIDTQIAVKLRELRKSKRDKSFFTFDDTWELAISRCKLR